jgi:cell division protein FtsW (lipid II flippase)
VSEISDVLNALNLASYITLVIRYLLPLLAVIIVARCAMSLLRGEYEGEEWGALVLPAGVRVTLAHWENVVGRAKSCDVSLQYPTLSRTHAALIRDARGDWRVYDLKSRGGVSVNGKYAERDGMELKSGDKINFGGVDAVFIASEREDESRIAETRTKPGKLISPTLTLILVTQFQVLLAVALSLAASEFAVAAPLALASVSVAMWFCYALTRAMRRTAFEVETVAFFLSSIGMAVAASSRPDMLDRQLMFLAMGVGLYFAVGWFLRDLNRAKKLRWGVALAGLGLLAVNIVFGGVLFGAKNWLEIGGVSFQPSEFVKIAFAFAGAATLDRLFARRNLIMFVGYAGACLIALALMSDFGTALVFFVAYLVIAFLRSGDFATVLLSVAGAGFAGFLAIQVKTHVASRFASWGHAWEYANTSGGYQQTRTMAAAATGGLFGVGAGNGWLKHIFAADTDMAFGMMCEELGLIVALSAVAAIIVLAVFAARSATIGRSAFYVIGACATIAMLMTQTALNALGSMDILPFTGVTFPFVSRGGSSLVACWGMLAFVKACDTRQNASFTVGLPKRGKRRESEEVDE